MIRSRFTKPALVAAVALVLSLPGHPAFASAGVATDVATVDSVVVSGTGSVAGTPDTLIADFGVQTDGSTVAEALDRANAAATRMRDSLVRAGVAKADLQTSNVNVGSHVDDHQAITGYTVTEGLTAKVRDLRRAGALLSATITAGGDAARLNGVSLEIENDTPLLAQARKRAFADARQKADLYAHEAGRPLGRVLTVSEVAPGYPAPVAVLSPAMDARLPIEPGRQPLTVTVTVEWALG